MLFNEKIYLSNCDSIRNLTPEETRKRVLIGLVFGKGIILSPNILFDNTDVSTVLSQKNVIKYLNEEGFGNFIIRGKDIQDIHSFSQYFEKLPNSFKISNLNGKEKGRLSSSELFELKSNIKQLDEIISQALPIYENANIVTDSLSIEINKRISAKYFESTEDFLAFTDKSGGLSSRSEWYHFLDDFYKDNDLKIISLKKEIIDPAYNSLFINSSECFIQDNIKILEHIPEKILSAKVTLNALKNEIDLIKFPIKVFELVTTLGTTDLVKVITKEALNYLEEKTQDKGLAFMSRKNWFGLYPLLRTKMGLEIK